MDGLADLARRVARLETDLVRGPPRLPDTPVNDLLHFISLWQQVTSTGVIGDTDLMPCADPVHADALAAGSPFMDRLATAVPEIVDGVERRDSQYWIATAKPPGHPKGDPVPTAARFSAPSSGIRRRGMSVNPFGFGMFTSTGALGTYGMWRLYLELNRGSALFPHPWHIWSVRLSPDAVVREIGGAAQWVEFVSAHPYRDGHLLYPDWESVAEQYDAVHITLRAIAAMQGLYLLAPDGIVAASYWDVETTLWLRWRITTTELVEVEA